MSKKIIVEPSVLSADFACLGQEVKRAEMAGADALHIDIMDGHFVPNLTMGPKVVAAIRRSTSLFLDVHLMVYNPFEFVERFVEAGANRITFHLEATEEVSETLKYIHKCNVQAGLAISPETSVELLPKYLSECDLVLLMTVNPGFGGQEFMSEVLDKISFIKAAIDTRKLSVDIQVDGGINETTAKECVKAGANVLVAGTYIYGAKDMKHAINSLRGAAG